MSPAGSTSSVKLSCACVQKESYGRRRSLSTRCRTPRRVEEGRRLRPLAAQLALVPTAGPERDDRAQPSRAPLERVCGLGARRRSGEKARFTPRTVSMARTETSRRTRLAPRSRLSRIAEPSRCSACPSRCPRATSTRGRSWTCRVSPQHSRGSCRRRPGTTSPEAEPVRPAGGVEEGPVPRVVEVVGVELVVVDLEAALEFRHHVRG